MWAEGILFLMYSRLATGKGFSHQKPNILNMKLLGSYKPYNRTFTRMQILSRYIVKDQTAHMFSSWLSKHFFLCITKVWSHCSCKIQSRPDASGSKIEVCCVGIKISIYFWDSGQFKGTHWFRLSISIIWLLQQAVLSPLVLLIKSLNIYNQIQRHRTGIKTPGWGESLVSASIHSNCLWKENLQHGVTSYI